MLRILRSIKNSFLILILLTANTHSKDIRLPKDVGSGNSYSKSLGSGFKKHGYTIVNKKEITVVKRVSRKYPLEGRDQGKTVPKGVQKVASGGPRPGQNR